MVRTLLIVSLGAACSAPAAPTTVPLRDPAQSTPAQAWDKGHFVVIDKEKLDPDADEGFEISQMPGDGYHLEVIWKRKLPTGDPASGTITLDLDSRFVPLRGEDTMILTDATGKQERSTSAIRREPDGRFTTEHVAADGTKTTHTSTTRNDFFIGEMFTSFLTVLCHADAGITNPTVYPDKQTVLDPPQPMAVEGTTRNLTYRRLTYVTSKNEVIVACEDGKLAGEVTRGTTIVRRDDLALARELEKRFR